MLTAALSSTEPFVFKEASLCLPRANFARHYRNGRNKVRSKQATPWNYKTLAFDATKYLTIGECSPNIERFITAIGIVHFGI